MVPEGQGGAAADTQDVLTQGFAETYGQVIGTRAADRFGPHGEPEHFQRLGAVRASYSDHPDSGGSVGFLPGTDKIHVMMLTQGPAQPPGKILRPPVPAQFGKKQSDVCPTHAQLP